MLLRPDEVLTGAPESLEAYLALVRAKAQRDFVRRRRRSPEPAMQVEPVRAYVNHGRWVTDCRCHAGVVVHPEWDTAACLECCTVYTQVVVPADWDAIETVLLARPVEARNWRHGDTLADLVAENARHGAMV